MSRASARRVTRTASVDIPATCLGFSLEDSSADGNGKETGDEEGTAEDDSTGWSDEEGTN